MLAENVTFRIHKIARFGLFARKTLYYTGIIAVGNKAYILTVRFFRIHKAAFIRKVFLSQSCEDLREEKASVRVGPASWHKAHNFGLLSDQQPF